MNKKSSADNQSSDYLKNEISETDILFTKNPLKAAAEYEKLLKSDPGNTGLHMRLGLLYIKLKQTSAAKEHLYFVYEQEESGLQPTSALYLALINILEDNKSEAQKLLKECIEKRSSYKKEALELTAML